MIPNSSSARALLAFVFAFCATASTASAGTLTGTIRAAATGQPLGSKVVAAYDTTGTLRGSATSDPAGTYILPLPAGSYRVLAYDATGVYATMFDANAESFETTPLTTIGATDTVRRDFSLVLGGTITGAVIPVRDGLVVEAYNLSGTRRGFTTTNAQGSYSIVLPPGDYKLVAFDPSGMQAFSFYRDARTFAEATAVHVTATNATSGIDFRLTTAARLTGTVLDAATRTALGGMTVYAYTPAGAEIAHATTDQAGSFTLSVPAGTYRLVAADPLRVYAPTFLGGSTSFETSGTVTVGAGEQRSGLSLSLVRGATVAGRVIDTTGAPVPNVTAAAYNLGGTLHASAATGADGRYELLVAPGTYRLVVFDPRLTYATAFLGGARTFDTTGVLAVAAGQHVSGFDFVLARGGRVTGTVREGAEPRAGITVAAYDAAGILLGSAVTNASGAYDFVLPPGAYRLVAFDAESVYAPAYDGGAASFDQTVPRSIAAGAVVTADFSLHRGVRVTGTVTDENNVPLHLINVFALDAAGNRVAGAMTFDGDFTLAVPPGTYRFLAADPSGRYATELYANGTTVVITETQSPRIRFVLGQRTRRRGVRH